MGSIIRSAGDHRQVGIVHRRSAGSARQELRAVRSAHRVPSSDATVGSPTMVQCSSVLPIFAAASRVIADASGSPIALNRMRTVVTSWSLTRSVEWSAPTTMQCRSTTLVRTPTTLLDQVVVGASGVRSCADTRLVGFHGRRLDVIVPGQERCRGQFEHHLNGMSGTVGSKS